MFSANSDTQGKSISSGASDLGVPRIAAPAVPASSSGGRSLSELLGPDANSYINSIMVPEVDSDTSARSLAQRYVR
eukprot:14931924-Heterocapsa_arctica.AAC.1